MTPFSLQILREIDGQLPPSPWGAAVGSALEYLYESGYITAEYGGQLTDKGRDALEEADEPNS